MDLQDVYELGSTSKTGMGGLVRRAVAFQELRDAIPDATLR